MNPVTSLKQESSSGVELWHRKNNMAATWLEKAAYIYIFSASVLCCSSHSTLLCGLYLRKCCMPVPDHANGNSQTHVDWVLTGSTVTWAGCWGFMGSFSLQTMVPFMNGDRPDCSQTGSIQNTHSHTYTLCVSLSPNCEYSSDRVRAKETPFRA